MLFLLFVYEGTRHSEISKKLLRGSESFGGGGAEGMWGVGTPERKLGSNQDV